MAGVHGSLSLGGKQMNETEAVPVDWKPADVRRMYGVEDGVCGRVQARGPPQPGAQRRLPWGSDL